MTDRPHNGAVGEQPAPQLVTGSGSGSGSGSDGVPGAPGLSALPTLPGPSTGPADRVWTVPNLLSFLRLLGVPVFLALILRHRDGWALLVLALAGVSDYADGKIARALGQASRLGALLDPAADRLYILATLLGLAWRSIVPWWLVAALVARELFIASLLPGLRRRGLLALPVHFVGKAATFALLYAFPLILLGHGAGAARIALPVGWAFAWWGTALYWVAAALYAGQYRDLVRRIPPGTAGLRR